MADDSSLPRSIIETLPTSVEIAQDIRSLERKLEKLRREMNKSAKRGAVSAARSFVAMRRLKDRMDDLTKLWNEIFMDANQRIMPEVLEQSGLTSVPLEEGFRVQATSKLRASIFKDKKAEAYTWLKSNKLKALIVGTVNAESLSAAFRSLREENIEPPSEYFNVVDMHYTSVTKTKGK